MSSVFGQWHKNFRIKKGFSRSGLDRAYGGSKSATYSLETRGKAGPRIDTFISISKAYKMKAWQVLKIYETQKN